MKHFTATFMDLFKFIKEYRLGDDGTYFNEGVCYEWKRSSCNIYINIDDQRGNENCSAKISVFRETEQNRQPKFELLISIEFILIDSSPLLMKPDGVVIRYANGLTDDKVYPITMNTVYQEWYYGKMQTKGEIDKDIACDIKDAIYHAAIEYLDSKDDEINGLVDVQKEVYLIKRIDEISKELNIPCVVCTYNNASIVGKKYKYKNVLDAVEHYHERYKAVVNDDSYSFMDLYSRIRKFCNEHGKNKRIELPSSFTRTCVNDTFLADISINNMKIFIIRKETFELKLIYEIEFIHLTNDTIDGCNILVKITDNINHLKSLYDSRVSIIDVKWISVASYNNINDLDSKLTNTLIKFIENN